jgi:hypothetical protein
LLFEQDLDSPLAKVAAGFPQVQPSQLQAGEKLREFFRMPLSAEKGSSLMRTTNSKNLSSKQFVSSSGDDERSGDGDPAARPLPLSRWPRPRPRPLAPAMELVGEKVEGGSRVCVRRSRCLSTPFYTRMHA